MLAMVTWSEVAQVIQLKKKKVSLIIVYHLNKL